MSKKYLVTLWAFFFIVAIFMVASPNPAAAENTLKIGSIWGLSGPGSQIQVAMRDGAVLAAEWINKQGGIACGGKKYKIELLVEDNKGSAEGSMGAATKLVLREKVKFITGMIVPFQIEAARTVTEQNKVILAVGKLSAMLPENPYTFSCTQGLTVPIPGLYDFMLDKYPSVKTVGFTAPDEPGALKVLGLARSMAKKHGLELMEPNLTQFGAKDYYPVWSKILKDKPDAVDITVNFFEAIATLVRHGRELGFKGPIVTVTTGGAADLAKLIGEEWTNDLIAPVFDVDHPNTPPMVIEIKGLWSEKYKKPFPISALIGWSSVWCLSQAIEKAPSLDTAEVKKAWQKMETIETPWGTGTMGGEKTFGINNMVIPPTCISLLNRGKVEFTQWYLPKLP